MDALYKFYKMIMPSIEQLKIYQTYHVKNYKGYELDCLNNPERKVHHDQTWEQDLEKVYQMGKRLAKK